MIIEISLDILSLSLLHDTIQQAHASLMVGAIGDNSVYDLYNALIKKSLNGETVGHLWGFDPSVLKPEYSSANLGDTVAKVQNLKIDVHNNLLRAEQTKAYFVQQFRSAEG
jgi:hypothetical protein